MRTKCTIGGFSGALWLVLASCGSTPDDTQPGMRLVIGDSATAAPTSLYQMPTPNELFGLVREMAGEGQKRLMNPATSADDYATAAKRAMNFGVYSTDLIYASYFDLNVEVVRYYLAVKKLGDQLGITAAFDQKDFSRLETNVTRRNNDSIQILSDEAYYKAYQRLQDEDMGPALALVLAGGWVESMHLVMQQVNEFKEGDPLVRRVAEQKFTLEHLIDMTSAQATDSTVAPVRRQLMALRDVYDRFPVARAPHTGKTGSGRMILGDDVTVTVSEEHFLALKDAVEALREQMVRTESQTGA